jgi:N6-adenosine-specific RNA methylase IME4
MDIPTNELKPHPLNDEWFPTVKKDDYEGLRKDIEKHGVTNDLHVLPDKTILCGHQRHKIAVALRLPTLPCKVVNLTDEQDIKRYMIRENLFRRHYSIEEKYRQLAEYSKTFEVGRGGDHGNQYTGGKEAEVASLAKEDVITLTAKECHVSPRTIVSARQYARIVEERPELRGEKVTKVLRAVKKEKQKETIKTLTKPSGKFNVLVFDPPWEGTGAYDPDGFRGAGDYPTMSFDEIKAIKPPAENDCVLWLWGIDLHLKETLEVIEAWGFERKSTLIWVKDKMGLGHYLRNQHEYCFLCTKGKPVFHGESIPSVLHAPRRAHSEKPEEFYKLVEKASPYPKKLDYFARKKREGWAVFGDEVEK